MSPLEIEILMHYGCIMTDYRDGDHSAPAVKDAIARFIEDGLLRHEGFNVERFDNGKLKARYTVTERTRVYLEALCQVPLPMQKWVMPDPWKTRSTLRTSTRITVNREEGNERRN